ncbi:MAG: hypothetical protein Q8W45_11420 [Candidatus Palauibacterales bacterium]|nr:hypothetical protein [Candidatus Palauibacterales bacterium]MDP2483887.1 hypothetical protein [Candidatus Palauibacterales bacterium]
MFALRRAVLTGVALSAAASWACGSADRGQPEGEGTAAESASPAPVVEFAAKDYAFVGPAEIASGWTTIRLKNEGMEHHFLLLSRLPEGKTFEDYAAEVGAPFDSVWHELRDGTVDRAGAGALLGQLLPAWYAEVVQMGGPGLVGPGRTAQVTERLDPGDYVIECYVKTSEGEFHGSLGMARPLTVTSEDSGGRPPQADLSVTLFNYGFQIEGTPEAGKQTIEVNFDEHPEVGLGNDVHVVRLDEGTDLDKVIGWMDWMNIDGLRTPAPATFLGGLQEMPSGYTAFFTVDLEPGRYAWIAESGAALGMVKEFTVE